MLRDVGEGKWRALGVGRGKGSLWLVIRKFFLDPEGQVAKRKKIYIKLIVLYIFLYLFYLLTKQS